MDEKKKPVSLFPEIEERVLKFWSENDIFEKSVERRKDKERFVFYEGPPYANGKPGIHHVLARAFKDIVARYKTMRGYCVPRQAGWDTHGLPTEMAAEKMLGIKSKRDIEEKVGIEAFVKAARENVFLYKAEWEKMTTRMGYWLDMSHPYVTMENSYIESLWAIIKKIHERGLLYQADKALPWCLRCGTALSSHELAQGYKKIKESAVYIKFKLKPKQKVGDFRTDDATYLVVWTTTPWTLPGNVALAVNQKVDYVAMKNKDIERLMPRSYENSKQVERSIIIPGTYIFAKEIFWKNVQSNAGLQEIKYLLNLSSESLLQDNITYARNVDDFIEKHKNKITLVKGSDFIGLKYEPLYQVAMSDEERAKAYRVIDGDFVSTEDGTGVVHIAPAFGEDDMRAGQENNLPILRTANEDGTFKEGVARWQGQLIWDANQAIIEDLKARGLLLKEEQYEHDYPFCWRCESKIIYFAKPSWWIKMSALRDQLLQENQTINWHPQYLKDGRFGEWLREVKDWAFSRERYWGTPLPVWQCRKCQERDVLGSVDDLRNRGARSGNRYIIMRHGEAEHNVKNISNSSLSTNHYSLTDRGLEQIQESMKRFTERGIKPDMIFVSPFLRTKETATIIAKTFGVTENNVKVEPRIGEINVGIFDGKPSHEYHAFFSGLSEKFIKAPPNGGETVRDISRRVLAAFSEMEERHQNKTIIIVTHEYTCWALWMAARGATNEEAILEKTKRGDDFLSTACFEEIDFVPIPRDEFGFLDLHKPYIDSVILRCSACGGLMRRVPEVIDVWFDSGAMPFASRHWPFVKEDIPYPADYICEAIDQTRGWFYTLLAVGVLLERGMPYKNVVSLGLALDEYGKKMSKSRGNIVDPWQLFEKYGADAVRWYFFTVNQPWDEKHFSEKDVADASRRFFMILWNCYQFFDMYQKIETKDQKPKTKNTNYKLQTINYKLIINQWVLARLTELVDGVTNKMDSYDIVSAARDIEQFVVEDFSRWYIRRIRDIMKRESEDSARQETEATFRAVLLEISKLLAPFAPFIAEELYRKLGGNLTSVHWENWSDNKSKIIPSSDGMPSRMTGQKLLEEMKEARRIVSLALEKRAKAGIKVRQPLQALKISAKGGSAMGGKDRKLKSSDDQLVSLIKEEINVKEIIFDVSLESDIALDVTITAELMEEGILRDIIREIQSARKEAKLKHGELADIFITAPADTARVAEKHRDAIARDTSSHTVTVTLGNALVIKIKNG